MSGNVRFSGKKNLAIVALLTGSTIQQAAQRAGVSERQLFRWLKSPDFIGTLRQEERQVLDAVGWNLVSMSKQALDCLKDVLERPAERGANVKRLAAVSVLELLLKWREQADFETRLQDLERQVFSEWK